VTDNSKLYKRFLFIILVVLTVIILFGCTIEYIPSQDSNIKTETQKKGLLTVHFIDVGQADSILVTTPGGKTMLIDAGNNSDDEIVIGYLESMGISTIDVLIGTHPHEDHIGAMDDVIKRFKIGKFYMPKVAATTKTFKDVLSAASLKRIDINTAKSGIEIELDNLLTAKILAPISTKYDDLNNYSAVVKLTYGKISFLFTGDAEKISENEMIEKRLDLSATVLKVGHHGSNSSTSNKFLNIVNPQYAVISVGEDNDYNHPSSSVLDELNKRGIKVLRTDKMGTITISTDGNSIETNFFNFTNTSVK